MPKSHDDPDEVDDIEAARQRREAAERRWARRTHPDAEDTVPPPRIETPWPSSPGVGSPSATIRTDPLPYIERHARWLSAGKAIAGTIVALLGAMYASSSWLIDLRVKEALEKARKEWRVDESIAAANSAASAAAQQGQRLVELERKVKRDGQRWDALDRFNKKSFQRSNMPPIPKFGPKAEARGEAALPEDFDDQ